MNKSSGYTFNLMKKLKRLGVRFIPEFFDGHKHVDIRIPKAKMDIEVDGDQHLTDATQIVADVERSHYSDVGGFVTVHIPNDEIKKNAGGVASAIAEASAIREEELK